MKVLNAYGFSTATLRREHVSVLHYTYINCLVVHSLLFSLNPSQILCNGEKLRKSVFSYIFFMLSCITTCVGFRPLFSWVCRKCVTGSLLWRVAIPPHAKIWHPTHNDVPFGCRILWVSRGEGLNWKCIEACSLNFSSKRYLSSFKIRIS